MSTVGRHLSTIDLETGVELLRFEYDNGLLSTIYDGMGTGR